ncbi:MAG: hypothetical protein NZ888_06840 [Candidatus Nitrosocaldus sp.]|nr:hypothetical protein [Candidatus Nitrosocaldus sp.]MDW8000399.1 hypothetical protein [Candidatus Nitrosocaldus sp.]
MGLDPLHSLEEARAREIIPEKVYSRVMERYRYVSEGIARVERASGIGYPEYYIEPRMVVAESQYGLGLMFARTIPVVRGEDGYGYGYGYGYGGEGRLSIVVQVTAALVAYGLKGTIHAILAHEFLHYIELLSRFVRMDVLSDEVTSSIFEGVYADMGRLVEPSIALRGDRALIRLIARKFNDGLSDRRLEDKCLREWIDKGLPTARITPEENIARIPIEAIASLNIDEGLRGKIYEFISASSNGRGRRRKKGEYGIHRDEGRRRG